MYWETTFGLITDTFYWVHYVTKVMGIPNLHNIRDLENFYFSWFFIECKFKIIHSSIKTSWWVSCKQCPGPYAVSWTITHTVLYYLFNMTYLHVCESITILSVRMAIDLCEQFLEIIQNPAKDALFNVNNLSWPLYCSRYLDNFQCPFYMFHLQITSLSYSDKIVMASHRQVILKK